MRHDTHVLNTRAHVKERIGQLLTFAGKEVVHVEEFGPGDIGAVAKLKETRSGDWLAAREDADRAARAEAARAGDGVRDRAEEQGGGGQGVHLAAAPAGGGSDDRPAPRPPDRRADRRRPLAGARGGDRRPPAPALRGGGLAEAPAGALPGDDPRLREGARASQEAVGRPRAVRGLPHRDRAAGGLREFDRLRPPRVRVREPDQGRGDPELVHPRGGERACARRWSRGCSRATP